MENKLENINIEQNKELFEYEMTEVILNLKGEFAVFSGKNTKFAEMAVDDSRLKVNAPEVVQVKVDLSGVDTPTVGSVQCPETVSAKVEESNLKLPIIPQFSSDGSREEGSEFCSEKINVWHGISLPKLSKIENFTIVKRLSEQSLEDRKNINTLSVKIPHLIAMAETTPYLEKKTYSSPISIHAPKADIKHRDWIIGKIPDSCVKKMVRASVPQVRFSALTKLGEVKKLSEAHVANSVEIKVPHVIKPFFFAVKKEIKEEVHTVEIPLISPIIRTVELRETHKPKFEINNPTFVREEVYVPEIKHIQAYKCAEIGIKHQTLLIPNAQKCVSEKIDIERSEIKVLLPETEILKQTNMKADLTNQASVLKTPVIPKIRKNNMPIVQKTEMAITLPNEKVKEIREIPNIVGNMDTAAVAVPAVSIKEYKPTLVKRMAKYNIEIPATIQPGFNCVTLVEYNQSAKNIEIQPVKVGGILDKVVIDYHETITIPQKPEVKETVDNIIALAVAKH